MAQISSSNNTNSLPGIVTDQPEIFESEPILSDDTGVNDLDLNGDEPVNDAICTIDIPMKEASNIFAGREHEIFAKFFVQKHGEYRLTPSKPDEESDYEKYNRLVIEVNELLNKFQLNKMSKEEIDTDGGNSLSSKNLTNNLSLLSKQLKALEFAAEDGSLNPTQAGFLVTKSKLENLDEESLPSKSSAPIGDRVSVMPSDIAQQIRVGAIEKRLNFLERVLGHNQAKEQNLLQTTNCDSLTDVAETLSSWLSLFKPDSVQRVNRELDYLTQRLEKINSDLQSNNDEDSSKLDPQAKARLDQLCNLVLSTDEYRAKVPTIIHRLKSMEELQQKAAQVATTVNYIEQIQAQIVDNLHWNKDELKRLNEMFATNLDHIKEVSIDIDKRIATIREEHH